MTEEPDQRKATQSHYFSDSPATSETKTEFVFEAMGRKLRMRTASGVFSQHGLDKGTEVLLDVMRRRSNVELKTHSHIADIGCGTGAIALTLAVQHPHCSVTAVDVNERARELTTENAHLNGLKNVTVLHPDEVDTEIRYSLMWSNPPIRIGKEALHDLLLLWLHRLTDDGLAYLVVNKNLGADSLMQWLNDNNYPAARIGSSKGFRVLEVLARP